MARGERRLAFPSTAWILTAYGLGWGAGVVLSGLFVVTSHDPPIWGGLALGWTVAAAGAAIGLLIKVMAMGGDLTRFLIWGLLVNGGRAAIFLLIVVAVSRSGMAGFRPFVIAVFSGYFTCMISEVAMLHTMTLGDSIEHE